jgi:cell division protein ZapA (FtsZ GTPase activity inhibitor)
MTGTRSVYLDIDHQKLSLRTDRDEAILQELARYVDQQVIALRKAAPRVPTQQVYLLVALQLADELFAARDRHRDLGADVLQRGEALVKLIDAELGADKNTEPG